LKKRTKKLLHIGSRLLKHRNLIFKSILLIFSEKKSLLPSVNALADVSVIDSCALFYHSVGDIRGRDVNGRLEYPNPNWPRVSTGRPIGYARHLTWRSQSSRL
jgi:hypothetical protein